MLWLLSGAPGGGGGGGGYLLDFVCTGIQFYLLLIP